MAASWGVLSLSRAVTILHNPIYATAIKSNRTRFGVWIPHAWLRPPSACRLHTNKTKLLTACDQGSAAS